MEKLVQWFVDKNFVSVRSFMLYISVYMTMYATQWAAAYADTFHDKTGTDLGLIIVAVTGPITAFTGFVYKFYSDSRTTPN